MLRCSKCLKVMEDDEGTSVVALKVTIDLGSDVLSHTRELWKQNLGHYAAYLFENGDNLKLEINLCYECWLDSLFQGETGIYKTTKSA